MKPTSEQLTELKRIELEMLQAFIEVCQKLNLRYYLLGGTLLGAIRHKGFIPWDDDIDVGMPREDYMIFLNKGQALLPEKMFIQGTHSEPEYPMCFAKIRNSETTFVESSIAHLDINHGAYIDVFPLDYYPEGKKEKRFAFKNRIYSRRIAMIYRNSDIKTIKQKCISFALKMLYPNVKTVVQKREKLFASVSAGKRIANHGGAWGEKEIMPTEWYGKGTVATFENMEVQVPEKYHEWLTRVYGDYMQLPPEEKRVGHHYVDVIDLCQAYTKYTRKS